MRALWIVLTTFALVGCGSALPTYEPMAAAQAWRLVSENSSAIPGVYAEADALLTGADGSSVRVDAALVLAPPDRVRVRAWKLGHAVLDVTSVDGIVWVDSPGGQEGQPHAQELGVAPSELVRALLMIPAWQYADATPDTAALSGGRYVYELPSQGSSVTCELSAQTLTMRRWGIRDAHSGERTLELDDYRLIGDIPWAHDALLQDGPRTVRLRFRDVELGGAPNPDAFVAPATARRLP